MKSERFIRSRGIIAGMKRSAMAIIAAALSLAAFAKDFPEPAPVLDGRLLVESPGPTGLSAPAGFSAPAGLGASFEYGNYVLAHDDFDSFYFALRADPVFAALGRTVTLSGSFAAILMCGPVPVGDTPANIAAFWMNSVQFEYALRATIDPWPETGLPESGRLDAGLPRLLLEYGRYSQHPLRGLFSEVTADILTAGLSLPPMNMGRLSLLACLRAGYHDIFAFWQSSLGPPRASWILKPQAEVEFEAAPGLYMAARAYPSFFLDRYDGEWKAELAAEAGLSLGRDRTRMEFVFILYGSDDSEILRNKAHATFEAGFAFRTATDRAAPRRPPSGDSLIRATGSAAGGGAAP